MDNDLGANDPYNQMDSGKTEIRPDFLKKNNAAQGVLSAAETVAAAKTGGATKAGGTAKTGASKTGAIKTGGETGKGLYTGNKGFENNTGTGTETEKKKKGMFSGSGMLKAAAPFLIILLAVVGIIGLLIALPVMMIGALDYNLQKALGFTETVGILEQQGEYVTAEMLSKGEVPSGYASDLAAAGIAVGQVTVAGEFVRTNNYIANIEEKNDLVAAAGNYIYNSSEEGELAILFEDELVTAANFVAAVENNPRMYAAYSTAADLSSRYYYGDDVEQVYADLNLSRGNFNDWEATGNYSADEESYLLILNELLDDKADLTVGDKHQDAEKPSPVANVLNAITPSWWNDGTGNWSKDVSEGEADGITTEVAEKTKEYIYGWHIGDVEQCDANGLNCVIKKQWLPDTSNDGNTAEDNDNAGNATQRAAELLNTAISSGEPYLASNAFIAIEEPVQRARIGDNGPVNQVMNTLTKGTEVSYQNVATGATEKKNLSILETPNFRAAVSDSSYSADEAANFGRDRVLTVTGQANAKTIKSTTVGTGTSKISSSVVRNGVAGDAADKDTIAKANESVNLAISKSNSEMFQSVVGANRAIEGGSYLSNTINSKVIGAMPSDAATITAYHAVVEETLARKAEAERATLSPFDISSPNTFFGSIVHKFATMTLGNYKVGSALMSVATAAGNVASASVAALTNTVSADGGAQGFTTMYGNNCATVKAVSVEGDLYCTSHTTNNTEHMNYTREDWKNATYVKKDGEVEETHTLGEWLDEENNIKDGADNDLAKFVSVGMDRYTTVGVKSADACEAIGNLDSSWLAKVTAGLKDLIGLFDKCNGVAPAEATGAAYTFGPEGYESSKLFSGYMLYDEVYSLLSDEESAVSNYRERYFAKYPKDNSAAGQIARMSGMSKAEATLALSYGSYLNEIAKYDVTDKHVFGKLDFDFNKTPLEIHSNKIMQDLYAWHIKEIEYYDLRNRNILV